MSFSKYDWGTIRNSRIVHTMIGAPEIVWPVVEHTRIILKQSKF